MKTALLTQTLNDFLDINNIKDYCPNGMQVEGNLETTRIVCGVTASLELIEKAIEMKAQTIIVHHGYFWKNEDPRIIGVKKKRLSKVLTNNINLLAYHLPLDINPVLGNNVLFGKMLGIGDGREIQGHPYVHIGTLPHPMKVSELADLIGDSLNRPPLTIFLDSDKFLSTVAWSTGAAQDYLELAYREGAQAFISGEISERTVLESRELDTPYFSVGHHASETLGIEALSRWIKERFTELEVTFVNIDNPV